MKILSWLTIPYTAFVFLIFFKIGLVFFGGGYVLIPVLHRELVSNLHLLTEREFIDGMAISQLTPGPVAILATFAGYRIQGIIGALTATFAMFLPGIVLMLLISKSYEFIKDSTSAQKILNTLIPVIVGLLIATCWQIGQKTITNWIEIIEFFIALFLIFRFKINPAILILFAMFLGIILKF